MVSLKVEKENKFLDHCWISIGTPTLVVLAAVNRYFIFQNDQLKIAGKEIDVGNINITEVNIYHEKNDDKDEDNYGLHAVLDDIIQEKEQSNEIYGAENKEK